MFSRHTLVIIIDDLVFARVCLVFFEKTQADERSRARRRCHLTTERENHLLSGKIESAGARFVVVEIWARKVGCCVCIITRLICCAELLRSVDSAQHGALAKSAPARVLSDTRIKRERTEKGRVLRRTPPVTDGVLQLLHLARRERLDVRVFHRESKLARV